MGKTRTSMPARQMKPVYLIFCEGETEEVYVDFLKQAYRSPIKIIPRVEGANISSRLINTRIRELKISKNDKLLVFLMYDMDVVEVNKRLLDCKAFRLLSNPAVELWFLLHAKDKFTPGSSDGILHELKSLGGCWADYEKAYLSDTQKEYLWEHRCEAVERARQLEPLKNPSSGIFHLILSLEKSMSK